MAWQSKRELRRLHQEAAKTLSHVTADLWMAKDLIRHQGVRIRELQYHSALLDTVEVTAQELHRLQTLPQRIAEALGNARQENGYGKMTRPANFTRAAQFVLDYAEGETPHDPDPAP